MVEQPGSWQALLLPIALPVAAAGLALLVHGVLFKFLARRAERDGSPVGPGSVDRLGRPSRWILVALAVRLVLDPLELPLALEGFVRMLLGLILIGLVAWLFLAGAWVLHDLVARRFKVDVEDNLRARKVHTQLAVLHRILVILIVAIALGSMLMTFPKVRQLGTALFASAGLLGIVVGLAAQKTIATFIAGLQIAFTQPIRVDDALVVEGEWGRVEEITLTYVVLRIWDLRRLIVPITYFIEKPFQNWTRVSADLLGAVVLHADHTVPVESVRSELRRIVEGSESWDRKACTLQVTGCSERAVELRALVSAADASKTWNLRCEVREKLLDYLRREHPEAFPRIRATVAGAAGA